MYRIYCDDKTLHDVRDEEYQLIAPKISLELNKTGSFEFGMLPSHPHANDIGAVPVLIRETVNLLVRLHVKVSYLICSTRFSGRILTEASQEKSIKRILILQSSSV